MDFGGRSTNLAPAGKRAQSSVELLIILAVGLVILLWVFSISQDRISTSQQALAFSLAKNSVSSLANSADAVYYEGVGSKRQTKITIPEGAVLTMVSQNSISIKLANSGSFSDAVADTNSPLCTNSFLPSKPGDYLITVESLQGCVIFGSNANFTASTTLISVNSFPNSTQILKINYSNPGSAPLSVKLNLTFIATDLSVVLVNPSDVIFSLQPKTSREVLLNLTISPNALGSYYGSLAALASDGENITAAIAISVVGQSCGVQQACQATSNVAEVSIRTYSSSSFSSEKQIFDVPETILIQGGEWDPQTPITVDLRDPSDSNSISGFPLSMATNSSGGFNVTLLSDSLDPNAGYIIRATGISTGFPATKTQLFDINSCA